MIRIQKLNFLQKHKYGKNQVIKIILDELKLQRI